MGLLLQICICGVYALRKMVGCHNDVVLLAVVRQRQGLVMTGVVWPTCVPGWSFVQQSVRVAVVCLLRSSTAIPHIGL